MSINSGLIWERPARAARGPAPSLTRAEIAAAAVRLADTQGIEVLSMRALAVELGVGAASLYRYVARKDELIDLMVDAVMGTVQFDVGSDWREDLRSFARGLQATILRHPWMATAGAGRTSLGPNTAQCFERILGAIADLGLTIDEMLSMIATLDAFIRGRALEELADQEAIRRSGLNNEQWMNIQAPYVQRLIGSGRYPLLSRVVLDAHGPHDPDRLKRGFELGLELVLNGLATMLPGQRPGTGTGTKPPNSREGSCQPASSPQRPRSVERRARDT